MSHINRPHLEVMVMVLEGNFHQKYIHHKTTLLKRLQRPARQSGSGVVRATPPGAGMPAGAPQMCWSLTAEDFTRHQLSHVTNFWRQGWTAEFQLKALPNGQAELCLTFQLPSPSENISPPINPALSNPPRNLVRSPHFPRPTFTSPKAASKRQRKH